MSEVRSGGARTLDPSLLGRTLAVALECGGEYADVFAEDRRGAVLMVEDDRLDRLQAGGERGVGVRVVAGEVTGYAYANGWDASALLDAARAARSVARDGTTSYPMTLVRVETGASRPTVEISPETTPVAARAELALRANRAARAAGPAIRQVTVRLVSSVQRIIVATSDGVLADDERRALQLVVSVTAERAGIRRVGRRTRGGQIGLEVFEQYSPEGVAREAAEAAIAMLDAVPAPAGPMPVVVGNGWGGVLFHEAVGHGLEADHVVKRSSVYAGRLGERVAQPAVTLVDDATVPNHRGSFRIDDEGVASQRTPLVVDGILEGYLTDRKSAQTLGLPTSGNGRRQSYERLPIPRMTNLYITPGTVPPEAILADTKRGLYVASLGGGQVDTTSGQFVFSVTEGYLIEEGQIGVPVRGATLAGDSFGVLARIDAVGTDFALDPGLGSCGKLGQWVPVGVGQPTLRVSELIVGGTAS
ncbi:MAG: TldD/PmbA family protein [Chloroflexi bacterium]|nr:TldD/PmbA family protein [Chloroflexota bacterium]